MIKYNGTSYEQRYNNRYTPKARISPTPFLLDTRRQDRRQATSQLKPLLSKALQETQHVLHKDTVPELRRYDRGQAVADDPWRSIRESQTGQKRAV